MVTIATGRPGTSSEAGQIGRSSALLQTAFQRQGTGQRMLTLIPCPPFLAVTPATVALAMTCRKHRGRVGESRVCAENYYNLINGKLHNSIYYTLFINTLEKS